MNSGCDRGALEGMAQAIEDRDRDHDREDQPAEPAGVEERVEVDVVRLFEVVLRGELLRADAERVVEDQPHGLVLAAKATLGAGIIALLGMTRGWRAGRRRRRSAARRRAA